MQRSSHVLDRFTTYTTHFELHASGNWDELVEVATTDNPTKATTRRASNGTLLINTRADAHQHIDNIRYQQVSNSGDPSGSMVAAGLLTMDVIEPGGTFFAEKIRQHGLKYSVTGLSDGLIFGLKIFFVGRLADNTIETHYPPYIIPMQLIDMGAKFDFKGGEYKLQFAMSAFSANPSVKNDLAKVAGYVNKNIIIKANTINEALGALESNLNDNYEKTYQTELKNDSGAKKIVYKITNKSGLDGPLNLVARNSYAPNEPMSMTFSMSEDITTMVRKIMASSKEVNEIIGASKAGAKKPYHPGVKVPTFTPRYLLGKSDVTIAIDIDLYAGAGATYNFNFLFGEPGSNVDVLDFEMKFPNMIVWMNSKTEFSAEFNNNLTSTVPASKPDFYAANLQTTNKTVKKLAVDPIEPYSIGITEGNVAFLNQQPSMEKKGVVRMEHNAAASSRLAFDAKSQLVAASNIQASFTIRGNYDLLIDCIPYPDGSKSSFGTTSGVWCKVDIRDQDGQPFFYTDAYYINTVDNIFSGGKFTQILTVIMGETQ